MKILKIFNTINILDYIIVQELSKSPRATCFKNKLNSSFVQDCVKKGCLSCQFNLTGGTCNNSIAGALFLGSIEMQPEMKSLN